MIRKLRARFILFMMLIVSILLSVMMGMVIRFNRFTLREQSVSVLKRAASLSANRTDPGEALPEELPVAWFSVLTAPDGELIAWGSGHFDLSDQEDLRALLELTGAEDRDTGVLEGKSLRYYRSGRVVAFADISGEELIMRNIRRSCVTVGLGSLVLFFLLSLLLAHVTARPVEKAWNQQRQFVADASHELKTPLTVILTNAELMQTDPDPRYARSVLTMSQRMRTLVESLLELARVDGGAVRASFEDTGLSALIEDELLPFEPVYFERGLTLDSQIDEGIRVTGSPRHLRQAVSILLDNAMKYAPEGSTVTIRLTRQGGSALLTAANPAPPMSREECQNIFRRFYRSDPARSGGGYGLGLPIARGILTDHGGKLWAESEGGMLRFCALIPLRRS